MELLAFKIAALAACGFLLFYVARAFSGSSSNNLAQQPLANNVPPPDLAEPDRKTPVPRVGSEIPFPLNIHELEAELEEKYGPEFFRPRILNYYFSQIDLETGPMDPTNFCDQFSIEFENPSDGYSWTSSAMVTTPKGLGRMMDEERKDAIWERNMLVVKRYDLRLILRSFLEDMAELHAVSRTELEPPQEMFNDNNVG